MMVMKTMTEKMLTMIANSNCKLRGSNETRYSNRTSRIEEGKRSRLRYRRLMMTTMMRKMEMRTKVKINYRQSIKINMTSCNISWIISRCTMMGETRLTRIYLRGLTVRT